MLLTVSIYFTYRLTGASIDQTRFKEGFKDNSTQRPNHVFKEKIKLRKAHKFLCSPCGKEISENPKNVFGEDKVRY